VAVDIVGQVKRDIPVIIPPPILPRLLCPMLCPTVGSTDHIQEVCHSESVALPLPIASSARHLDADIPIHLPFRYDHLPPSSFFIQDSVSAAFGTPFDDYSTYRRTLRTMRPCTVNAFCKPSGTVGGIEHVRHLLIVLNAATSSCCPYSAHFGE